MTTTTTVPTKGGHWLIEETRADAIFTPEQLTDEHRLIEQTANEFMTTEVVPALDRLEQKDWALARTLVGRCGELGLLGTDVPEALGGVGLDKAASMIVGEAVGRSRIVRHDFRRADRARDHATPLLRHRGSEAALPAAARQRRDHRRLRAQRVGIGIRCARRTDARGAAGGRQLPPHRREDVDHQRRLRRSLHRLCQGRRRAVHRLPRRARLSRREHRQGRAQARDCTARRRRR